MSEHSYDLSKSKTFKEVITKPSSEQILFTNDLEGQVEVGPKGKDLVITVYAQKKGEVNYKKVLGTITIVDGASFEYINKSNVATFSSTNYNGSVYNYVPTYPEYDFSDSNKSQTILGSDYSETFYGGTKADKITTGSDFYSVSHDIDDADIIDGGKGDDQITIDGFGLKQIYVNKGDGNDTVDLNMANVVIPPAAYFTGYVSRTSDIPVQPVGSSLIVDATIGEEPDKKTADDPLFVFTKRGADLIIEASHGDETTESLTVKSYFNMTGMALNTINYIKGSVEASETSPVNFDLNVNGESFKESIMPSETLVIAGVPVKELLTMVEKEFSSEVTEMIDGILKVIKVPPSIMNANVFIGTETDNEFLGTNNKDIMLSTGGDNYFKTGDKGLSVIASLGNENDDDIYDISSFEAGTVIIDKDGEYNIGIGKVDTNDIHMIGINTGSTLTKDPGALSTTIEYLTDTKGVKNITGLDFNGIYNKVMDVVQGGLDLSDKKQVKAINSVISTAAGLIDKFRGVGIVVNRDVENDGLYDDLNVTDKNDNEHIISANSQEANTIFLMQNISAFAENMSHKFGMSMADLLKAVANPSLSPIDVEDIEDAIEDEFFDNAFVKKYFKHVKENTKEEIPEHYELSKTAVKEITSGLTDVFTNSYVGTDQDNSFTISHSDAGAVVAAGTGSDTFTFKGELGSTIKENVPDAYNPENLPVYNIVSSLDVAPEIDIKKEVAEPTVNDQDTIVFKNYTMDKDLYTEFLNGYQYDIDKREVYGMDFYIEKGNKTSSTLGEVHYIIGEDGESDEYGDYVNNTPYSVDGNKFALTVKDKSSTYEISVEQNDDAITENWSKDKSNHYAVVQSSETEITTGKSKNMIESYGASTVVTVDTNPTLTYTYGGGQDEVISRRESNDTYYAKLTGKTNLVINDKGWSDSDSLILTNTEKEAKNIRAYFNVNRDGDAPYGSSVSDELGVSLISGKLSKSSFDIVEVEEKMLFEPSYVVDGLKNGIDFNYNYCDDQGIENICYGEDEIYVNMDAIVDQVQSELASWFNTYDYDCTDDAIIANDTKAIKDLVAVYNSVDLTYGQVA